LARLDIGKLEEVKARLGEVILDPAQWTSLMDLVCAAAGTTGSALLQSDVRTSDVPMTASVEDAFKSYFYNNLHVGDVRATKGVPLLLSGRRAIRDQDLFPSESVMLRDPLYANAVRFGLRWWSAISFHSGDALWALALQRSAKEGLFEDDELRALATLSDSLTEVATLSKAIGRQVLLGTINALEMFNEPIIAMAANGKVLEINRGAESLFGSDFRVRDDWLYMWDKPASDALQQILSNSIAFERKLSSRRSAPTFIVARRQAKRPISIKVLPVHSAASSPFFGARLILSLRDLDVVRSPPLHILSEIFSLTRAEARVALMVADGASPEAIADQLQLSRETVRNQIKAVMSKTNTHRQNELAALISRIQS
jgi:DNA-binding CsgD family transcriptional regulator